MIELTMQERATEAVRQGVLASLTGAYFHVSEADKFGLNNEATTWLYSEALAHQIYMLSMIANQTVSSAPWATGDYFMSALREAMELDARKMKMTTGTYSYIFNRCRTFDSLGLEQRVAGEHFRLSARAVAEKDSKADVRAIEEALRTATEKYADAALKMFRTRADEAVTGDPNRSRSAIAPS